MEELEVTVSSSGRVVWHATACQTHSPLLPGLEHDWLVISPSQRGAQKQVTESLIKDGWTPVRRWVGGARTFVRS